MTGPVTEYNITDDGWAHVPLDFTFPFQNGFYTSAFMFSNGVVGFIDPSAQQTYGLCCDGQNMLDPTNTSNYIYNNIQSRPGLNFNIFGLHTDLIKYSGKGGKFYTQGDESGMRFFWENISEFGQPNNLNTFDVGIYPSGNIHIHHEEINITNHDVTVGISGNFTSDVANYTHYFYKRRTNGGVFWNGIGESPIIVPQGGTLCEASPISHTFCPGYATAFAEAEYNNSCLANPQFDSGCPGYQTPVEVTPIVETTPVDPTVIETPGVDSTVADVIASPEPIVIAPIVVPEVIIEVPVPVQTNTNTSTQAEEIIVPATPEETVIAEVEAELATVEAEAETTVETDNNESSDSSSSPADNTSEESDEQSSSTEEIVAEENDSSEEVAVDEVSTETKEEPKKLTKKERKAKSKRDKMKKIITNKLKELANDMATAATIEAQQAVQAQINALINYVPGFNAYGQFSIPGVTFYTPEPLYVNKRIPENNRGLLNGLASQILHEKMIDLQYKN
ncbi:hypothetical protein N9V27_00935 [bacterium]|nr:hypothetical protein [bacterium]